MITSLWNTVNIYLTYCVMLHHGVVRRENQSMKLNNMSKILWSHVLTLSHVLPCPEFQLLNAWHGGSFAPLAHPCSSASLLYLLSCQSQSHSTFYKASFTTQIISCTTSLHTFHLGQQMQHLELPRHLIHMLMEADRLKTFWMKASSLLYQVSLMPTFHTFFNPFIFS